MKKKSYTKLFIFPYSPNIKTRKWENKQKKVEENSFSAFYAAIYVKLLEM